jgi:hypothetical protein
MRIVLLTLTLSTAIGAALAEEPKPAPDGIGFPTVAAALAALSARDGDGVIVTRGDGWVQVTEPLASARWSFTPPDHPAYPAVVRRVIKRSSGGEVTVETTSLCEAPQAECSKLLAEFAAMNDRITQAVKARGRQPAAPAVGAGGGSP